jgi:hypothetical protein
MKKLALIIVGYLDDHSTMQELNHPLPGSYETEESFHIWAGFYLQEREMPILQESG